MPTRDDDFERALRDSLLKTRDDLDRATRRNKERGHDEKLFLERIFAATDRFDKISDAAGEKFGRSHEYLHVLSVKADTYSKI